ncbi:hypothetical protein [Streptomyces sp. NPDC014676]|uniref:hypothetical protein n=1 Tax=Streptomyces sp. NPDC014676 TaxID=3364879 RepID=UPI0036FCE3AA
MSNEVFLPVIEVPHGDSVEHVQREADVSGVLVCPAAGQVKKNTTKIPLPPVMLVP